MTTHRFICLLGGALMAMFLAGCASGYRLPVLPASTYAQTEKVPLTVDLRLTDKFRAAKCPLLAGTTVPIGTNLCRNAEILTRSIFTHVIVTHTSEGPIAAGADAVLTPRIVAMQQKNGVISWSHAVTTILIEWTLKDRNNNVVWVNTIQGEGRGHLGSAFTLRKRAQERLKQMLSEVFRNSFQSISRAKEIRRYGFATSKDGRTRPKKMAGK